ncbi:MAG: monovalent cation/H(+) antiporter subunit G [Pseudomonadota bacterium]
MGIILDLLSWVLLLSGGFFVIVGAIGVIRFPDFYTRLHAAGVTDTLGADLILLGLLFQAPGAMVAIKLLLILFFFIMTSPVATHSVAHAAYAGREAPLTGKLLLRQNVPLTFDRPLDDEAQTMEAER